MAIPKYCEKGSRGSAIPAILSFLAGYFSNVDLPEGFQTDDELGELGMVLVARYQEENELSVDGGVGPQMRADMLHDYRFDFELAARSAGGTTIFVQPDGTEITWSPADEAPSTS